MWSTGGLVGLLDLDLRLEGHPSFSQYNRTCRGDTSRNMLPTTKSVYRHGLSDSPYQSSSSTIPYNSFNNEANGSSSADSRDMIGFGRTEWMRVWADQIYQFKRPASTGEANDKKKEKDDAIVTFVRNDIIVRSPPRNKNQQNWKPRCYDGDGRRSGVQDFDQRSRPRKTNSSNVNVKKRFNDITKVRRDGFNPNRLSNELMKSSSSQSSGTSFQKKTNERGFGTNKNATEGVESSPGALSSTKRRIVTCNNAEDSDWQERAKRRKMRFENNLDVTLSGAESKTTKTDQRSIVIDGNNVAYNFGDEIYFDWEGILICAKYFKDLGCVNVKVVVPEIKLAPGMTKNEQFAEHLKKTCTMMPCPENVNYNQFVLKTANKVDAILISNEILNDKKKIATTFPQLIERTVNYHFDNNDSSANFVPKNPSGPTGPTLEELLRL